MERLHSITELKAQNRYETSRFSRSCKVISILSVFSRIKNKGGYGKCTYVVQRTLKTPWFYGDDISKRDVEEGRYRGEKQQPGGEPCSARTRKRSHISFANTNEYTGTVRTRARRGEQFDGGYCCEFRVKLTHRRNSKQEEPCFAAASLRHIFAARTSFWDHQNV